MIYRWPPKWHSLCWTLNFVKLSWVGCDSRQTCVLVARLYFSFCSDILDVALAVLHQSIPCLLGIMISKSVLVGEAVLTSILMSLIVEHVHGVWPLSWTLTRQALQSLRAMPDQCTIHAGTHSYGRLCSMSPWLSRWPAPRQTEPQTWKLLSDSWRYC